MTKSLREDLMASMDRLEGERQEVLDKDKELFGVPDSAKDAHTQEVEFIEDKPAESVEDTIDEAPEEPKALNPLSHWDEDKKNTFNSLTLEAQEFILEREKHFQSDYTKKTQNLAEQRKVAEKYQKSIDPYKGYLEGIGLEPEQAFEALINVEMALRTASPREKIKMLNKLARDYGIEYSAEDPIEQEDYDPKLARLEERLDNQERLMRSAEQKRIDEQAAMINEEIARFQNTKDDKGRLKYPHFETVKASMGANMKSGNAQTLAKAYEISVLANDELRDEYILNYNKDKVRREDNKRILSESKKATFNVRATGSAAKEIPPQLSLRDTLLRAMAESQG